MKSKILLIFNTTLCHRHLKCCCDRFQIIRIYVDKYVESYNFGKLMIFVLRRRKYIPNISLPNGKLIASRLN